MQKVIVAQFVSLDGVTDDPDGSAGTPNGGWAFRYGPGPVAGDKFALGALLRTGVNLLGRTTWELFAGLFASREDDFSRALTAMDKIVATRSGVDVGRWANSTALETDLVSTVRDRVRHQDVVVTGSGCVVDQLIAQDLVDEFRLLVFPTVLGKGRRIFDAASAPLDLTLVSSEDAGSGVLRQVYTRRR
ncbi:dihydrofolate reductase family protein [Kutzneria chonburiensis]|uniref:Dihydrofolate reductase family protein n=1 Tax=Kutzneria chonburiensis TaxID=1483604 RepID=A0ABV6N0U5_9PSEU|nr:dihydrofolate reductase family protein [Kutzneria chonburiensis]